VNEIQEIITAKESELQELRESASRTKLELDQMRLEFGVVQEMFAKVSLEMEQLGTAAQKSEQAIKPQPSEQLFASPLREVDATYGLAERVTLNGIKTVLAPNWLDYSTY
jgi:DNA-binding protein H-NS